MKIPSKWQVFDTPVILDDLSVEFLSPYLVSWTGLSAVLAAVSESNLQRLVILELLGKQRRKILDRILMRLGKVQRKKIEKRIERLLP